MFPTCPGQRPGTKLASHIYLIHCKLYDRGHVSKSSHVFGVTGTPCYVMSTTLTPTIFLILSNYFLNIFSFKTNFAYLVIYKIINSFYLFFIIIVNLKVICIDFNAFFSKFFMLINKLSYRPFF